MEESQVTTVDSSQNEHKESLSLEIESFRVTGWQEVEFKFSAALKDLDASAINATWIHIYILSFEDLLEENRIV